MKALCIPLLLSSTIVAGAAGAVELNAYSANAVDKSARYMLYVQKPVGEHRQRSAALKFGFSIDRESARYSTPSVLQTQVRVTAPMRIFDLRFSPFAGRTIELNGIRLNGRGPAALGFESGGESWSNPWVWVGIGAAVALGISCASDNWPCESSSSSSESPGL